MMAAKYIFVFLMIGVVAAQENEVSDALSKLPPDLQGQLDEKQILDIQNKSQQVFKEKCEKNGGVEAFTNADAAFADFRTCISQLVDQKVLQEEIDQAKPTGQVDEVFKKYCGRSDQFKSCFHNMTEAAKPCFTESEQGNLKTIYNVTEQLAEFICFKQGDRIALFIAEGGPECLQSKQEELQACANKTIGDNYKIDTANLTIESFPELSFGEKECDQMTELQRCVVATLETCEQPTSANIMDSLFKFIRKATPCKEYMMTKHQKHSHNIFDDAKPKQSSPGSASGLTISTASVIMAMAATYLV